LTNLKNIQNCRTYNWRVVKWKNTTKIVSFVGQIWLFYFMEDDYFCIFYGSPCMWSGNFQKLYWKFQWLHKWQIFLEALMATTSSIMNVKKTYFLGEFTTNLENPNASDWIFVCITTLVYKSIASTPWYDAHINYCLYQYRTQNKSKFIHSQVPTAYFYIGF